ncbi:biotin--[acetyl-CoA-carboxylase] ligase [Poseidonibacter antarcticus]|uniref:biotin--[acetyl-CoA-carboxylase] ligase n=1 Tax=Poseidonibacter antarcticus TaxID=2478538 RepID=UPI000EF45098|nr:biotin--[acetyl-CoA-carboxylase] ligase [Poseidonibacter antarcticus]
MRIIKLNEIDSTHRYLKDYIKNNSFSQTLCIQTDNQTNGIGSRGNSWQGTKGNLFFSFVISKNDLPNDLPIQSASIYFSYLLKQVLKENKSNVWLKWPNDFYINDKKIGGTITTISNDLIYCGIGLNLISVSEDFGKLDININSNKILELYFDKLERKYSWKQVFSDFKIEFENSKKYQASIDNQKVSLENAILNEDGSIEVNNKKVFSLR